jgi:NADP-dependent 3-hydroxy-3-methylglutaryl-CoA reductase
MLTGGLMFERRSKDRVEPAVRLNVTLCNADGEVSGRILELSPHSLVVRSEEPLDDLLATRHFDSGTLETPSGSVELAELALHGGRDRGDLVITVHDPDSQGRLWDVYDRLCHPHPDALDSSTVGRSPGSIPAKGHYTEAARQERMEWLRRHSGRELIAAGAPRLDPRKLTGNIENFVGSVELPVGVAGPLLFDGDQARGYIVAPLATTEGSLVASTSRGAAAITRAGGVRTRVISQTMVRAPIYEFTDVHTAVRFTRWTQDHMTEIREEIGLVSQHAELLDVEPWQAGRMVYLRFVYRTGDAAGQNMTTACTWRACRWINEEVARVPGLDVVYSAIEGNASGDKKVSYLNYLGGRGSRVTAECFLDRATVEDVLKTTPETMEHGHYIGSLGGVQTGMLGYSINVANVIAAIYTATGQDIACVHESGTGIFSLEAVEDGLRASMVLPSLVVGTVGGGTALPTQRDFLEMLDCSGSDRAARFAEIICGFALALDLSTQAAVTVGQFADAHERLGRSRPVEWLRVEDLVPEFFQPMLAEALSMPDLDVSSVVPVDAELGTSIITELTARGVGRKLVGLYPLRLSYDNAADAGVIDVVAKVKALDEEVILASNKVASACGGELARTYSRWRDWTGFKDTHTRELAIYRSEEPCLRRLLPRVYGVHEDPAREAYVIVMERLDETMLLRDAVDDPSEWTIEFVDSALRGIAGVHARWLGREQELLSEGWLGRVLTGQKMVEMKDLWYALAEHNAAEYPDWIDDFSLLRLREAIASIDRWWDEIETMPRTLVHNDFNPRNIAFRADRQLVAFDWELATVHLPQRDLAELLAFVLAPDVDVASVEHHVEVHRRALEASSGMSLDRDRWRRGYRLALRDFVITRMQMYLMGHAHREYAFLPRVVATVRRLVDIEAEEAALKEARKTGRTT